MLAAVGIAAGDPLSQDLAPDRIEGTLAAAVCVGSGDRTPGCVQRALAAGQPGGIRDDRRFTMLLVDGRILGRTCAARGTGRLRASGVLHRGGVAMSLFRLEQDCGQVMRAAIISVTLALLAAGCGSAIPRNRGTGPFNTQPSEI
ncbi:MAG: hypothetical protein E6J91_52270 [Deltaproteobacteria bacterium]|nr:MAG: hypothetical protein E6J91_52270 [Deltaproteobacteria bacterium]